MSLYTLAVVRTRGPAVGDTPWILDKGSRNNKLDKILWESVPVVQTPQAGPASDYSLRSASTGSTRVACHAGIMHAASATAATSNATTPKVIGSVGLTP